MFIAHLPAAYLIARPLRNRFWSAGAMVAFLIGSVAPDLDMIWFYLVDGRATHHHDYLTHRPAIWLGLLFLMLLLERRWPRLSPIKWGALGCLLHLALDSIAGQINWGWPIGDWRVTLVHVSATHDHWIKSFAAHWTFQTEILITTCAAILLARTHRRKS